MKIKTEVKISAAHIVHTTDSKCSNLHGHTWRIVVEIDGDVQPDGMVIDFIKIKEMINQMDHKTLLPQSLAQNSDSAHVFCIADKSYSLPKEDCIVLPIDVITAENMALMLVNDIRSKFSINGGKITVYESDVSYAEEEL